MKLLKGSQYKVRWIDAFGQASWTSEEEIDELLRENAEPAEQSLY
jgi:hypothetical protein